jgi:cation diffusion facilitator CzcD-associated flavoprotein CzcO
VSQHADTALRLRTDIVVIGAGQAGLSSAYHLVQRGLAPVRGFLVLDRSPSPGGAWQFRWPTLTLSTVNRIHDLPGMRFADAVDATAAEVQAAEAVPRYFAAYEREFHLPVYRPVHVTVVCDRDDRLDHRAECPDERSDRRRSPGRSSAHQHADHEHGYHGQVISVTRSGL